MISRANKSLINKKKKELSHLVKINSYDLHIPEIIKLSQEIDKQMLPLFKQQLDCNSFYIKAKNR